MRAVAIAENRKVNTNYLGNVNTGKGGTRSLGNEGDKINQAKIVQEVYEMIKNEGAPPADFASATSTIKAAQPS